MEWANFLSVSENSVFVFVTVGVISNLFMSLSSCLGKLIDEIFDGSLDALYSRIADRITAADNDEFYKYLNLCVVPEYVSKYTAKLVAHPPPPPFSDSDESQSPDAHAPGPFPHPGFPEMRSMPNPEFLKLMPFPLPKFNESDPFPAQKLHGLHPILNPKIRHMNSIEENGIGSSKLDEADKY